MELRGVLETAVYVDDLDAAERFYTSVLGLTVLLREAGRHVFFRCGRGMFLVFQPTSTATHVTVINGVPLPLHGARGPGHMAFRIHDHEVADWRQRLADKAVAIDADVVWPNGANSLYFHDPGGNILELATPRLWGLPEEEARAGESLTA